MIALALSGAVWLCLQAKKSGAGAAGQVEALPGRESEGWNNNTISR